MNGSLRRVVLATGLVFLGYMPVSAQPEPAQLQILNAGINLGWVSGIIQTEGMTAANVGEVGIDLANASAAITVLVGLIEPPYPTDGLVRANELIFALSGEIGGLPASEIQARLDRIMSLLAQSLNVYIRNGQLEYGGTCDTAILNVGFFFGQGHTAIQRGNVNLERRARGNFNASIGAGERASASLGCPFVGDDYRKMPMLSVPTPANYSATLAAIQGATLAGIVGVTPIPPPVPETPVVPPPPPPPPPPPAGGPASIVEFFWDTNFGEMVFDRATGEFGSDGTLVDLAWDGQTLTGFWVETDAFQRCSTQRAGSVYWGRIEFTFDPTFTSFEGRWSRCDGDWLPRPWTGDRLGRRPW